VVRTRRHIVTGYIIILTQVLCLIALLTPFRPYNILDSNVYFQHSAVCAPARTTIRTGCTIERTGIQHNDLITEYVNGPWFQQRVESLVGLDHVLVEKLGYLSEYYGKWHLPDKLWYSKNESKSDDNVIHYNDYDFTLAEPYFLDDSDGRKNQRYLDYWEQQGTISRALQEGQQYDTYTGYPYTPIQLDARARHGSPVSVYRIEKWMLLLRPCRCCCCCCCCCC
jgi:arylsulfatase A-like enzyme